MLVKARLSFPQLLRSSDWKYSWRHCPGVARTRPWRGSMQPRTMTISWTSRTPFFTKVLPIFEKASSVGRNKSAPLHVLPVAVPDAELSRQGKRLGEFAAPRDLRDGA